MKKINFILFALLVTVAAFSQSPQKMSYQAVVRNSSNALVRNSPVGIKISILQTTSNGTAVYVETQTATTNIDGLVTLEIGGGIVVSGVFSSINWANGPYYLKTEIDPEGGANYTISGMSQILSVPYAFYAKTAETSIDAVKTTGDQTIAGNKTFSGTTTVTTPLNATDAVTKAYVDGILDKVLKIQADLGAKDVDGNTYKAVKIGKQVWMAENLKTTKYNDGTAIAIRTDDTEWSTLPTAAYSDYNNTPSNSIIYGRLYNWYAVDNDVTTKMASNGGKNVCPTGWHIPTDVEWTTLYDYLTNNGYGYGGSGNLLGKSMAATSGWDTNSIAGNVGNDQASNNSSGFTGLPSGYRNNVGTFNLIGNTCFWWISTTSFTFYAYARNLENLSSGFGMDSHSKRDGLSVRCVKDN